MGIFDLFQGQNFQSALSALGGLGAQDSAQKKTQHMEKVFAANPAFAQALYGAKNQEAATDVSRQSALQKMAELKQPKYQNVGGSLLKILPNGQGFEKVYESAADLPSTIQIANEVEKALKAGDIDRANRLMQIQKVYDKGINPYGQAPQPGTRQQSGAMTPGINPGAPHPLEPPIGNGAPPQPGFPDIAAQDNPALDALAESLPDVGGNIPLPAMGPQAIPGYGAAAGSIAADKKRMETQAQKDVEMVMDPLIKEKVSESDVTGKETGAAKAAYEDLKAAMPTLGRVTDRLYKLADAATYTKVGKFSDDMKRQFGVDVGDSAEALAELQNTIDVEILPLLRPTFGAAFTVNEGQWLRSTLGDPNLSPKEKKAQLDARVQGWLNEGDRLARRTGQEPITGEFKGFTERASQKVRKFNRATGKIE